MEKTNLETAMEKHGITVKAQFVPFSQSRNAANDTGNKPFDRSLNWKVTLQRNGRDIVTTDYMAGIAHCPSYKQSARWTLDYTALITFETENGKTARKNPGFSSLVGGNPIEPKAADVVHSLISDSDVINYSSFEEWAENFGYDADSRKAESIYRACLEIALQLRAGLGESLLSELSEAASDY